MTILFLTFVLFSVVVGLMTLLVELNGRPLKGSCGGVGGGSCACKEDDLPEGSCSDSRAVKGRHSLQIRREL